MPLTDAKVKNARPKESPYTLPDGHGLYLEVRPSGAKFWRYRYWITPTKDGRFTIGEYPLVSLSEARKHREWAKEQVKKGLNPTEVKKLEKLKQANEAANTFELVAKEWIERKKHTWKEATKEQIESFLAINVYPALGSRPIRDVTAHDLLAVLRTMEARGSVSSAIKVRQWCSAIFCYAVATLRADVDPAAALKGAIIPKKVVHSRALTANELKDFYVKLKSFSGIKTTEMALRLLPLLFVRQAELRYAEWSEFDFGSALWVIPETKMKMRRPHSVPLSDSAINLLMQLKDITGANKYLFPNVRNPGRVMSNTTINRAIEYLGYPSKFITAHDFRATASTRLHEMGFRHDVIERQLAHVEQNRTVAAYNHAEYMPERVALMQAWDEWLVSLGAND